MICFYRHGCYMMDWKKIIKTALERTSQGTIRLHDLSLARMPNIPGWKVDKPTARDEMLGGGVTEVAYSGRTESGRPLKVVLDKDRGQWIASAGGMELDAPASGDVLNPGHVQDVLNYAMRQMDEEIAKSQRRQKPKGRPQAPRIPMFAEGHTDSNIRNAATRMAENIMARDNELTDPGNKVGDWPGGWLNGEWKCPKCHTIIGRNLKDESPHALVKQHECADGNTA